MNGDPSDNNERLPSWLKDAPLPPAPPGAGAPPTPRSDPAASPRDEADTLPDWLRDFESSREQASDAPSSDLPAWLSSQNEQPAAPAPAQDDLPAWLRESAGSPIQEQPSESALPAWLHGDAETPSAPAQPPEEPAEPAAKAETLPEWLRGLSGAPADASAEPPRSPDAPAPRADFNLWADEPAHPPAPAAPDAAGQPVPPTAETDAPSWLRDIAAPRAPAGDAGAPPALEPFSLDDIPDLSPSESGGALPAWLAGLAESEPGTSGGSSWFDDTPAAPPAASVDSNAGDAPAWLQNLGGAPGSSAPEPPSPATPPPDAPPSDAARLPADLPAWLNEAAQTPPSAPSADLPAWLNEAAQTPPSAPSADLPAWLNEAAQTPPSTPSADLPAWPNEAAQTPPAQTPPAAGEPPAELPGWLQDIAQTPPAAGEPPAELPGWLRAETDTPAQTPADVDMPAWLRADLPAAAPETPPPAPAPEPTPDWLSAPTPPAPPDTDLPAWLRRDTSEQAGDEQTPDWLQIQQPSARAEPPAPPARADEDLPPWLRDESGQPLPTAGEPGDSQLPEWLRGAPSEPPRAQPPAPQKPAQFDWFGEGDTADAGRASSGESEFFGGAELPAWLRPPEPEPAPEINPADARSLDWLTRLGTIDEESASAAAPAPKLPPPRPPTRSVAQREALALLQRLAADPFPQDATERAAAPATIWQRIGIERMLYLLLLAALLVGLAAPSATSGLNLEAPPEAPGARDLFARIDALTENDVVLVGYEWDARRISELSPLKEAVLGHLIQKKVKLALISTDPQGTLLLFDLRDDLVRANYRAGGEDYILLGYKPGGELALRSLAQDFRGALRSDFQGNDATQSSLATDVRTSQPRLATLSDLSMILVLADDSADVQSWMEQIHRSAPQTPMGFLLPAETAPIVQPYLKQPQIFHVAGKQGALAYQQLRGGNGEPTAQIAREAGQQRLSILVFIVLFLLGAVAVGAARATAGRRSAP